ncbi:MAG: rhodanese-like domain-containing protein [Bacteroidetes bacterium]|nr:rhodanese-like domain-containing protein [Bacteroidota bacterium]
MFNLLSFLGLGNASITDALKRNAVIIDVRTPNEYDQGRIKQSINIPVDKIKANFERLKNMNRPVILCCASGSRSGQACHELKAMGLKDVHNGGSWESVLRTLKKI